MAGDPRSTARYTRRRNAWIARAAAENRPCAQPGCTLGPIRYDLGNNHPLSPNLDHITPVDTGHDPYDETNWQVIHTRCNGQSGARYGNAKRKPRRQSRVW